MKYTFNSFVVQWRKYAALPILIAQILTLTYCNQIIYGLVVALWLTVPCGMKTVNNNKFLWYPRQLLFFIASLIALFTGFNELNLI